MNEQTVMKWTHAERGGGSHSAMLPNRQIPGSGPSSSPWHIKGHVTHKVSFYRSYKLSELNQQAIVRSLKTSVAYLMKDLQYLAKAKGLEGVLCPL